MRLRRKRRSTNGFNQKSVVSYSNDISDAVEAAMADDLDGDGVSNSLEDLLGTDPLAVDSDGDGANTDE